MFCLAHFISPGCPDGDEGYAPPGFCEHCRGEAARSVLLDRILLHPVQSKYMAYMQNVLHNSAKIVMNCADIVQLHIKSVHKCLLSLLISILLKKIKAIYNSI